MSKESSQGRQNFSALSCRRFYLSLAMLQYRPYRSILFNFALFLTGACTTLLLTSLVREDCQDLYDLCDFGLSLPQSQLEKVKKLKNVQAGAVPAVSSQDQLEGGHLVQLQAAQVNENVYNVGEPLQHGGDDKPVKESGLTTFAGPTEGQGDWSAYKYQLDPHAGNVELMPYIDTSLIYVVTPTYNRPEQIPELTRVAQALEQVKHLVHWVVVEDSEKKTDGLADFLKKFRIPFDLLTSVKPHCNEKVIGKPRGVGARRAAIKWLRDKNAQGILYFADDDNTYDSSIFREMYKTTKVSMWPVGLVTDLGVSSPIVRDGKVVGFYDGWKANRKFAVDMAGFAINLRLLHENKEANMPWTVGYEEDGLLKSLGITFKDIQPLANNCTKVLVWHTKAAKNKWAKTPKGLKSSLHDSTNLQHLLMKLPRLNPSNSNSKGLNNDCESKEYPGILKYFFGN